MKNLKMTLLLIFVAFFISCNVWFVEIRKKGTVSITELGYTRVVYVRRSFVELTPPDVETTGNWLVRSLVLKDLLGKSEEIILHERPPRTFGPHYIELAIVDRKGGCFILLFQNISQDAELFIWLSLI